MRWYEKGILALALALAGAWSGEAVRAADGPASQAEAEAWLKEALGWVREGSGLDFSALESPVGGAEAPVDRPPLIRWITPADAGKALQNEFGAFMAAGPGMLLPEDAQSLGEQFLARYLFGAHTILLIGANLDRVPEAEGLTALERAQALKLVLVHAASLALLNRHTGFAEMYYAPGNADPRLAARAVWEGFARAMQKYAAKQMGATDKALDVATRHSFSIQQSLPENADLKALAIQAMRLRAMDRLARVGLKFYGAVREKKGDAAILDALRNPPWRTSQVLVPGDYLGGDYENLNDDLLGETLAKAAGGWFPPFAWKNSSSPLGALSTQDMGRAQWDAGGGPRQQQQETFDHTYVAGRSLSGLRKDGKSARAAALHVFRTEDAAKRYMTWRELQVVRDWRQLIEQGFGVRTGKKLSLKELDVTQTPAGALDDGFGLHAHVQRPDQSEFDDTYYVFRQGTWILELNLDTVAENKSLGLAAAQMQRTRQEVYKAVQGPNKMEPEASTPANKGGE